MLGARTRCYGPRLLELRFGTANVLTLFIGGSEKAFSIGIVG